MSDFVVPALGALLNKPLHLVVLKEKIGVAKNAHNRCFISLDKPETDGVSFIRTKGFFSELAEEDIVGKVKEITSSIDKDKMEELLIPWVGIERIKNLVFKAK